VVSANLFSAQLLVESSIECRFEWRIAEIPNLASLRAVSSCEKFISIHLRDSRKSPDKRYQLRSNTAIGPWGNAGAKIEPNDFVQILAATNLNADWQRGSIRIRAAQGSVPRGCEAPWSMDTRWHKKPSEHPMPRTFTLPSIIPARQTKARTPIACATACVVWICSSQLIRLTCRHHPMILPAPHPSPRRLHRLHRL
jgi:hypothetical protein